MKGLCVWLGIWDILWAEQSSELICASMKSDIGGGIDRKKLQVVLT